MRIEEIKDKYLENFYYKGTTKGINPDHIEKLGYVLDSIASADSLFDLKKIYRDQFAEKKGSGKGVYSIKINGNWRITFQIKDGAVVFLDYVDYHGKQIKAR